MFWDTEQPGAGEGSLDPLDIHQNSLCIFLFREQTGGSFKPLSSVCHRCSFFNRLLMSLIDVGGEGEGR